MQPHNSPDRRAHEHTSTHPPQRVLAWSQVPNDETQPTRAPRSNMPSETMPNGGTRGGNANHTPAAADVWFYMWLSTRSSKMKPRRNHTPTSAAPTKQNRGPPDKTWDRQPTMQGNRKHGQDHTPASAGCHLNPQRSPPPKPQPNETHPRSANRTKPGTGNPRRETTKRRRNHTPALAATEKNSRSIECHTPAAAGVWPYKVNPTRAQIYQPPRIPMKPACEYTPAHKRTNDDAHMKPGRKRRSHTCCGGQPQTQTAATNATRKPQMMPCDRAMNGTCAKGQPKVPAYPLQMRGLANDHTPAAAGVILLPQIHMSDPRLIRMTRPMVNRQAQPLVPHTCPSGGCGATK
ncbi:hypothetical protein BS47DRAFT_1368944 [Hydnum rufescens UP504]|uniref:Uncharacterized protein n=1 Tax=Hydnum rufescens UP504 TaxID=1448309 RepID=A0A9P6AE27_9AGAM|nr:hypothetical protein BS47DRAFT_1368944 [Hydnum rufescens UP504]